MIDSVSTKKYSVTSLFSGCGGLDIPFSNDRYDILNAFDNDPAAIQCLSYNLKCPAKVLDVLSPEFEIELKKLNSSDIVLGGFPCQGFSKSGPKKQNDPRNQLYKSMQIAIEFLNPKVFIAENVDGLVQNFDGSFVDQIIKDFSSIGYNVEYRVLNAVNFGVAQFRRRIIFVGIKDKSDIQFQWPHLTHKGSSRNGEFKTKWEPIENDLFSGAELIKSVTIKDTIEDLLDNDDLHLDSTFIPVDRNDTIIISKIKEGQKLCNVRFSESSVYTWNIPEVFGDVSDLEIEILQVIGKNRRKKIYGNIPNGNPLSIEIIQKLLGKSVSIDIVKSLLKKGYLKEIDSKYDLKGAMFCSGLYKRPFWDEPSPTVLTVFDNPRYFVHPKKNRPFTIRECARLQSFPDSFKFLDSGIKIRDAYRLIGNAVPPLLASAIEQSVYKYLLGESK